MSNQSIKYGILLTKEQLDFLKDDRQGFHRMTAFDTFVSMASTKPSVYQKTGFSASLSIGQFAISTVELSALWKCDRKTAAKVVELFNQVGILSTERNNRTSIHTIRCIAFWYVDGIKEAIKNPFYNRQAVTPATQEKPVSDVPSDTVYSSGGNLSYAQGSRKTAASILPLLTFSSPMFLPLIILLPLPLILMSSGTDFQILLRYHKTLNKGKRKEIPILSMRLHSRQKMIITKAKRLHLLNCCRLLSMMTRATSCSLQPMKVSMRRTRSGKTHITPQVTHNAISPFPLFQLLTVLTDTPSRSRHLY